MPSPTVAAATRPPQAEAGPSGAAGVKLTCRGLWKIFGEGGRRFLERHGGAPTSEQLAAGGLIGAVRDAGLEIHDGEVFVIMGLSGSGKSTFVRCLSRLIEPTAGELIFEGRDLLAASERELTEIRRHKMGMVFQHFALLPHLTVLGNVAFPLEVQGVGRAAREARALEVIELVGLKGRESYFPRELSGGQQQRVGIARSLAVEPEIWFLDEPFSALDPLIRREMQDEFLRLQRVLRKTIVFITHDFDEAIRLADRIAIMKDGRIVQIGRPEDLVTSPATQYVAEFTRDVSRAKVLSVRSVMSAVPESAGPESAGPESDGSGAAGGELAGELPAAARIGEVARRVLRAERPFAVVDEAGRVVGRLEPGQVLEVLAPGEAAPGPGGEGGVKAAQ
ncbi:glycine betaine/proline transport system ATP-binding protein [Tistlia consotensis]|uniref:Quaternary amine transport ATP-binding protein n=1 Tax=Tistlia consotensis USBA 355 TaxID=560819 RepID=A0A1Y6C3Y1_9PROT|nr:betaine/proline/choline family ABC transporter ATP-binding protein [Tistlia consotensis]SMF36023.1 glycine betaine/proline transport system ATP-binding protein [Tistlia consotensis USBA 355]SNR71252.1 glycine betaine/proline transport system ATP-binding protein [Tistlia consotensis]